HHHIQVRLHLHPREPGAGRRLLSRNLTTETQSDRENEERAAHVRQDWANPPPVQRSTVLPYRSSPCLFPSVASLSVFHRRTHLLSQAAGALANTALGLDAALVVAGQVRLQRLLGDAHLGAHGL